MSTSSTTTIIPNITTQAISTTTANPAITTTGITVPSSTTPYTGTGASSTVRTTTTSTSSTSTISTTSTTATTTNPPVQMLRPSDIIKKCEQPVVIGTLLSTTVVGAISLVIYGVFMAKIAASM